MRYENPVWHEYFADPFILKCGDTYYAYGTGATPTESDGRAFPMLRLKDMFTTDGEPKIVNHASQEWHIYERNREYKGKVWDAWFAVEGPCVIYRQDRYWCLYSGGRWNSDRYGVGFAVADHPLGPWKDDFAIHGPVVLKGIPGRVVGPGHNSVTVAPDGRSDVMVYHAWDKNLTKRRMFIDPLQWTSEGPRCDGPSIGPRVFNEWHEVHPDTPALRHGAIE